MADKSRKLGSRSGSLVATLVLFAALFSPVSTVFAATYPHPTGLQRVIFIPVQFTDTTAGAGPSALAPMISLLDQYYYEVSYGRVNVSGEILPSWTTLSQPMRYYGADKELPGDDEGGNPMGSFQLVIDTIKAADLYVDYAKFQLVVIVHAGDDQAEAHPFDVSEEIWSQTLWDFPSIPTSDRVSVTRASILSEKSPFGAFAHEFGHLLGALPDLYDQSDRRNHFVGPWSLMDAGASLGSPRGSRPSQLESWSRIQLGWLVPTVSLEEAGEFLVSPLEGTTGTRAIQIPLGPSTYYLVEVRRRIGFDASLPGEGVLIYFVDESRESGEGIVRVMGGGVSNLDRAALGVGGLFKDDANKVVVRVVGQEGSSVRIRVSTQLEFTLAIDVKRTLSVFEFGSATVRIEPPAPDMLLDVYLDGELYRSFSTSTESGYEVFLLFDFAKIGEHTIRAVLLDRSGTRRISSEAKFEAILPPYLLLLLIALGALAVFVSYFHFRPRRPETPEADPVGATAI